MKGISIKKMTSRVVNNLRNMPRDQLLDHFENSMKQRQIEWTAKGDPITEAELEYGLKEEWKTSKFLYLAAGIKFEELLELGKKAIADTSGVFELPKPVQRIVKMVGRNAPCPCGSGQKYKKCCGKGA